MSPSVQSLKHGPDGQPINQNHDWLYATTDVDFFEKIDLACHGHIHSSRDYEIDGCRILANPRGYPSCTGGFENVDWKPGLVVEVKRKYAPKIGGM